MTKFNIKPRFISEYTNYRYNQIENDITINSDLKNAMLTNIDKSFSLLKSGLLPVHEYMKIIADIENSTLDKMQNDDIVSAYSEIFNNNFINFYDLSISGDVCTFEFNTLNQMLTFMKNEITLANANRDCINGGF